MEISCKKNGEFLDAFLGYRGRRLFNGNPTLQLVPNRSMTILGIGRVLFVNNPKFMEHILKSKHFPAIHEDTKKKKKKCLRRGGGFFSHLLFLSSPSLHLIFLSLLVLSKFRQLHQGRFFPLAADRHPRQGHLCL